MRPLQCAIRRIRNRLTAETQSMLFVSLHYARSNRNTPSPRHLCNDSHFRVWKQQFAEQIDASMVLVGLIQPVKLPLQWASPPCAERGRSGPRQPVHQSTVQPPMIDDPHYGPLAASIRRNSQQQLLTVAPNC